MCRRGWISTLLQKAEGWSFFPTLPAIRVFDEQLCVASLDGHPTGPYSVYQLTKQMAHPVQLRALDSHQLMLIFLRPTSNYA
jgi:hypothetical protein